MSARRYLTNVLMYMAVDAEHMSVSQLIDLLEYFAENPTEYIEFTNAKDE